MKNSLNLTSLVLLIFGYAAYSQNTLYINTRNCKTNSKPSFGFEFVTVYRNDTICESDVKSLNHYFENAKNGVYKVKYRTLFSEEVSKEIVIPDKTDSFKKDYEIDLCIDVMNDSIASEKLNLFFDRIKDDEEIDLKFTFGGCYESGCDSIKIFKKHKNLYLVYKNQKRKLKKYELAYFKAYETELRKILPVTFSSTSGGFNTLKYKDEIYKLSEPDFFWSGYDTLKSKLKLQ